jgi:DNA-binding IclR family transcriptional regulator
MDNDDRFDNDDRMGRISMPRFVSSPSALSILAEHEDDAAFATTLAKGLAVLEAFAAGASVLGNMELSDRTHFPRPTVARLTHTLSALGYLRYDDKLAKYGLGARALCMAHPLLASMEFRQAARPLMQDFAESVGGTVSIGLLDGTAVIYVETARSGNVGPHVPDIGMPIPVVMTAMGRAAAATLPAQSAAALERRLKMDRSHPWSAWSARYHAGIRECSEQGFCTCPGEYMPAIHAVAAPLFHLPRLKQSFAINCGIPAFRLQPGQLQSEIGPRIAALAASIRLLADQADVIEVA